MSSFDDYETDRFRQEGKKIQKIERKIKMENLANVTTGKVRLSFVHLFKPYAFTPGQEEKFSCTVLVPKTDTDTMARINAAIEAARQKGISDKWNGQCPPALPTPVYDGGGVRPSDGLSFGPECKGHWVFTASAKADYPPEIVDLQGNPIINQSEAYSGMYGRVNVTFFPYAFGGKKGIGCGLGPVQKVDDGEALGGSAPSAAQAFGAPLPQQPAGYGQAGFNSAPQGIQAQQPGAVVQPGGTAVTASPYPATAQPAVNPVTGLPM